MMDTNLVIVPKFATGPVMATPVDACEQCGGLFIKFGTGFPVTQPHYH